MCANSPGRLFEHHCKSVKHTFEYDAYTFYNRHTMHIVCKYSCSHSFLGSSTVLAWRRILRACHLALRTCPWVLLTLLISIGNLCAKDEELNDKNPTKSTSSPNPSPLEKRDFSAHYAIKSSFFKGPASIHIHSSSKGNTRIYVKAKNKAFLSSLAIRSIGIEILGQRHGDDFYPEQTNVYTGRQKEKKHSFSQDGKSVQSFYKGKTYDVRTSEDEGRSLDDISIFYQLALDQRKPNPPTCYYIVSKKGGRNFCYRFKENTTLMLGR